MGIILPELALAEFAKIAKNWRQSARDLRRDGEPRLAEKYENMALGVSSAVHLVAENAAGYDHDAFCLACGETREHTGEVTL